MDPELLSFLADEELASFRPPASPVHGQPLDLPEPPPLVAPSPELPPVVPVEEPPAEPLGELAPPPPPEIAAPALTPGVTAQPPLTAVEQAGAGLAELATGLRQVRDERGQVAVERSQAVAEYRAAETVEAREAAAGRLRALDQRAGQLDAVQGALGQTAQDQAAVLEAEQTAAATEASRELQLAALDESARIAESARADRAAAAERRREAEAEAGQARDRYQAELERDPERRSQTLLVVGRLIGEIFAAHAQGRPPAIGEVVADVQRQIDEQRADRLERARAVLGLADDDVARQAALERAIEADAAAERAAVMARLDEDLAREALRHREAPRGTAAALARVEIRQRREAAEAQAVQASETALLERRKAEADIRKAEADATIAERKARGGGSGAVRAGLESAAASLPPQFVALPDGTGIAQFPDTPAGHKNAAKAREATTEFLDFHQEVREMVDLAEQVGGRSFRDLSEASQREVYSQFQVAYQNVLPKVAKMFAGGFAATETDMKNASEYFGELGFTNATAVLARMNTALAGIEKRWERVAPQYLIAPESAIKTVAWSRRRTTTKREREQAAVTRSVEALRQPDSPDTVSEKAAAVPLVVEYWRANPPEPAANANLLAIQSLKNAAARTDDPRVEAAIAAEIAKLRKAESAEASEAIEGTKGEQRAQERGRELLRGRNVPQLGGL